MTMRDYALLFIDQKYGEQINSIIKELHFLIFTLKCKNVLLVEYYR